MVEQVAGLAFPVDEPALVEVAIEDHLPPEQFHILKVAEESEREIGLQLIGRGLTASRGLA